VNFKNTIIILTSNVGSEFFYKTNEDGIGFLHGGDAMHTRKTRENDFREKVMESLKDTFKPEFLNRLDEIIVFNALGEADIAKIVDIQLEEVRKRLETKNIAFLLKPDARQYLVKQGFDPLYGARPLKRMIQKVIVDPLADKIIKGEIKNGKKITFILNKSNRVEIVA
jgi:ATP-dependent Clp protease ATP-binding subunit ClpA